MNRRVVVETIEPRPNNVLTNRRISGPVHANKQKALHLSAHSRAAPITDGMILTGKLQALISVLIFVCSRMR
jgi:hypothetical protein